MTEPAPGLDFQVDRADWKQHRFVETPLAELAAGQVRFRVDRFALTANNVSYALAGDALGYWRFFPAPDGWGRVPVMGYGDVVASRHEGVAEGTRCFGFFPMSRYLVIEPASASAALVTDGAAHRRGLAPAYSQYLPVAHDPLHQPEQEDRLMLLRGLFLTGFLAADFLAEHAHFGAGQVLVSSASSKTAIALAHALHAQGSVRTVGLTSVRNRDFVEGLGCYDAVLPYQGVTTLDAGTPAVLVDMAGSRPVLRAVHEHFGGALRHSCAIGATHWDAEHGQDGLPGPRPEFFFAPAQIQKRTAEWGAAGFQERLGKGWDAFRAFSEQWLTVRRGHGADAVQEAWEATLDGAVPPGEGRVLSLHDAPAEASARASR